MLRSWWLAAIGKRHVIGTPVHSGTRLDNRCHGYCGRFRCARSGGVCARSRSSGLRRSRHKGRWWCHHPRRTACLCVSQCIAIGLGTVGSGRKDHCTPTGGFTILQKEREHYSNGYDSAPMPFMERLTWDGIAPHGGRLPGYPASHGCVRLPLHSRSACSRHASPGRPSLERIHKVHRRRSCIRSYLRRSRHRERPFEPDGASGAAHT